MTQPARPGRWLVLALKLGCALVLCEALLWGSALLSGRVRYQLQSPSTRNVSSDPVLGKRMSPYFPGHDARGYRNAAARAACDLLAVGDSWTYGYGAARSQAWPQQLERLTGRPIYNAGVASYGPCEYLGVVDELLELEPRVVLLGLYLGNDIGGAYFSVYSQGRFQEFKSTDAGILKAIERANREDASRPGEPGLFGLSAPGSGAATPAPGLLERFSALARLGRSLRAALEADPEEQLSLAYPERRGRVVFDAEPRFRTVFVNLEVKALVADLTDPRIQEGWRITQAALSSIATETKRRGVAFVVVLLHGKSYVYEPIVRRHQPAIGGGYFELVERAGRLRATVTQFLEREQIPYVDTLAALRAVFDSGTSPFHLTEDGHPDAAGYAAIARSLLAVLEE